MSNIFGIREVNGMPLDERGYGPEVEIKCDYVNCYAGMGMAGNGKCFLNGDPTREDCPFFQFEEVGLAKMGDDF